jgi:hypothetical protein
MYHHTQFGNITRTAAIAGLAAAVYVLLQFGSRPILWLLLLVAMAGVIAFSSLTVELDQERLRFWFGPGLFGRAFPLHEISAWSAVQNPWWYGWGIHLTPRGWLYNVSGREAVELEFVDGHRLRIGTDEPERLCEAIATMRGVSGRPAGG